MQPITESFSIVILGGWNPQIFSNEWMSANLDLPKDTEIITSIPMNNPALPHRIELPNAFLYPSHDRIKVTTNGQTIDNMLYISRLCKKILSLLTHTPVNGIGINFGFITEQTDDLLADKIDISDSTELESQYNVLNTEISRALKYNSKVRLNFKTVFSTTSSVITINFHQDTKDIKEYPEILSENNISGYYQATKTIMENTYGYNV